MSKSVKAALVANGLIAIAKGCAAVFTGSASMLAEAIQGIDLQRDFFSNNI